MASAAQQAEGKRTRIRSIPPSKRRAQRTKKKKEESREGRIRAACIIGFGGLWTEGREAEKMERMDGWMDGRRNRGAFNFFSLFLSLSLSLSRVYFILVFTSR
ncbi:hypothetical protein ACMFMF_007824 [Clarireedia jacksonii]